MKKLVILGVLAGGWYVWSNDLVPDFGLSREWSHATALARRAAAPASDDTELDRIQRMEADLHAQSRYLDELAARLQELRPGVTAVKAVQANLDDYNHDVETLNEGDERFRRLYATYRDDVDRYNARARRAGGALHRPMAPRADRGMYRRARPIVASVRR
jgi:hypothetical protein